MATISDVAKLSGISVSTVSRVINNKPHVSEDKRRRVLEAMEQLGYTPLQAARQMRGSGSNNIAVLVPTITNSFFAELVDSIEKTCRRYDYKTLITQTYGDKDEERYALSLLTLHHVDGMILCALENEWSVIQSEVDESKIVVCNEYNGESTFSSVRGKQYEGFYEATEYLVGKGYRRIAYCTGARAVLLQQKGMDLDTDRYLGYAECLGRNGVTANPAWLFTNVRVLEDGHRIARELMQMDPHPDAILAGSDEVAAGIIMEALSHGWRIPEDLAVVGVDDQKLARVLPIPLTTIKQPVLLEGQAAAEELIRRLQSEETAPAQKELELKLVIRETA